MVHYIAHQTMVDLDGLTQGNYGLRILLKHIEKNKEPEEIANFVTDSS